jgi:hypothetical protein
MLSYHSLSIKGDKVRTLRVVAFITIVTFLPISMSAQYGTAPNNYYPENYNGSTFNLDEQSPFRRRHVNQHWQ